MTKIALKLSNSRDSIFVKIWQHNYANGDTWAFSEDSIWVEYLGMVSVPAGNFDSCYYVHTDSVNGWIFAPDVGIVKTVKNNKDNLVLRSYSISTNIEDNFNNLFGEGLKIYPNPTNDLLNIKFENINPEVIQLNIYDLSGRIIYRKIINHLNYQSINISELPGGNYILHLITAEGIITRKLIKK